ncbi:MAG TPA: hypothetical protein ENJ05_04315 [Thiotrichales bacterium]|nr:hypothetical protein [Thiotrichales bacterium]
MNVVLHFKDRLTGVGAGSVARLSRRNRFFQIEDEGWYLQAREGVQGPFATLAEAEAQLEKLISRHRGRTSAH